MTDSTASGARPSATPGGGPHQQGQPHDVRDLWPRDFGRDGVSGLVSVDRAMRARDVSRPRPDDERVAEQALAGLIARVNGRREP